MPRKINGENRQQSLTVDTWASPELLFQQELLMFLRMVMENVKSIQKKVWLLHFLKIWNMLDRLNSITKYGTITVSWQRW